MAGRCAGLCCSFQHSLVYGAECFAFVTMDSVYALRALAVSAIISVVLAFAHVGLVKECQGWCSLTRMVNCGPVKDGAT
jgi:hypothetical protein